MPVPFCCYTVRQVNQLLLSLYSLSLYSTSNLWKGRIVSAERSIAREAEENLASLLEMFNRWNSRRDDDLAAEWAGELDAGVFIGLVGRVLFEVIETSDYKNLTNYYKMCLQI